MGKPQLTGQTSPNTIEFPAALSDRIAKEHNRVYDVRSHLTNRSIRPVYPTRDVLKGEMEPRESDDRDQISRRAPMCFISTFHYGGLSQGTTSGIKPESLCMGR